MYFDYYILGIILLPAILFSLYAEIKVKYNFNKYLEVNSTRGIVASDMVRQILNAAGIYDVKVTYINGDPLNNYYDPTKKIIALSYEVYNSSTISALGVACHEAGHALQYAKGYIPIKLRNAIIPPVNFISKLLWPVIFVGLLLNLSDPSTVLGSLLLNAGVIFFGASVLINLLTLPAEYDASNRAIRILDSTGALEGEELIGAKKVLRAAGLTYVAALFVSLLNLLRFIMLFRRRRD